MKYVQIVKKTSMMLSWCFIVNFFTYFTAFSSVSIVDIEQVNVMWDFSVLYIIPIMSIIVLNCKMLVYWNFTKTWIHSVNCEMKFNNFFILAEMKHYYFRWKPLDSSNTRFASFIKFAAWKKRTSKKNRRVKNISREMKQK